MLRGVYHGARGLAWRLIERYAEEYGGFPLVIATGGDAAALFSDDELVNQVVPDLVLRGIALAAQVALRPDGAADPDRGDGNPRVHGAIGSVGFTLTPGTEGGRPTGASKRAKPRGGDLEGESDHVCGPGCDHN
jgi:hypothetical protein